MTRFAFACPWAFLFLVPWLFAAWRMLRRTRGHALRFPRLSLLPKRTSLQQKLSLLPPYLFLLGLFCGIVALARPQLRHAQSVQTKEAIAIEMVVDTSGSMQEAIRAQGRARTRIDVVKETFRDFVEARPNDLIGLVSFARYATTRCPLTFDHSGLGQILENLTIGGHGVSYLPDDANYTSIGDGLAMACAQLAQQSNVVSRIAILLSDGENNSGIVSPQQAKELAKKQKIKVYTISLGEEVERRGFFAFARNPDKTLKKIAEETGGLFWNVQDQKSLNQVLEQIDKLEKTNVDTVSYEDCEERFQPWIFAAVLLLSAALLASGASRRSLL